jgi:hypothetical protein
MTGRGVTRPQPRHAPHVGQCVGGRTLPQVKVCPQLIGSSFVVVFALLRSFYASSGSLCQADAWFGTPQPHRPSGHGLAGNA